MAEENKSNLTLLAIVAIVAIVGLILLFWGRAGDNERLSNLSPYAGAIPTQVFDVSQSQVVGEVDIAAGICRYLNSGKLVCPGYPQTNTQLCLDSAVSVCVSDSACILSASQQCVDAFGSQDVSVSPGPNCDAIAAAEARYVDRTLEGISSVPNFGVNPCTGVSTPTERTDTLLAAGVPVFREVYDDDGSARYSSFGLRAIICFDGRTKVEAGLQQGIHTICSELGF